MGHAIAMLRNLAVAAAAAATLGCLPAQAQEIPELEGAPGYRAEARKLAQSAADRLRADQARLARQAEAQEAEQARLDRQAEDLKAQQARLDARSAELAAEEERLAQMRSDRDEATLAELARQRQEDARPQPGTGTADLSGRDRTVEDADFPPPVATPEPRRPIFTRLDFGAARRSCARAAEDEAQARNLYSAQYVSAPRFVQGDAWELRGRVRLEDRSGYFLVDTICELDAWGEARDFIFLR